MYVYQNGIQVGVVFPARETGWRWNSLRASEADFFHRAPFGTGFHFPEYGEATARNGVKNGSSAGCHRQLQERTDFRLRAPWGVY